MVVVAEEYLHPSQSQREASLKLDPSTGKIANMHG